MNSATARQHGGVTAALLLVAFAISGLLIAVITSFQPEYDYFRADKQWVGMRFMEQAISYGIDCQQTKANIPVASCNGVTAVPVYRFTQTAPIMIDAAGTVIGTAPNAVRLNATCTMSGTARVFRVTATWLKSGETNTLFSSRPLRCDNDWD